MQVGKPAPPHVSAGTAVWTVLFRIDTEQTLQRILQGIHHGNKSEEATMEPPVSITIESFVNRAPEDVWRIWNEPNHIIQWNAASDDWHTPRAEVDLQPGGNFNIRMEAKDGSMGFDLCGTYSVVVPNKQLSYTLEDGRRVDISFVENGTGTAITETFEAETSNPVELQRNGWQAILDNFKRHAESVD